MCPQYEDGGGSYEKSVKELAEPAGRSLAGISMMDGCVAVAGGDVGNVPRRGGCYFGAAIR